MRARDHLTRIAHDSIAIPTVETVKLLDYIGIRELVPVHDEILRSFHPSDAVSPKANMLVTGNRDVDKRDRNYHPADEWDRQDIAQS